MSAIFWLSHGHVNSDTDDGAYGQQFKHKIVKCARKHCAAMGSFFSCLNIVTEFGITLIVIFGCNSLILV